MSNVFQGFSFGIGSSIAHRTIGGLFGNSSNNTQPQQQTHTQSQQQTQLHENNDVKFDNKQTDYTNPNFQSIPACKLLHEEFIDCMKCGVSLNK